MNKLKIILFLSISFSCSNTQDPKNTAEREPSNIQKTMLQLNAKQFVTAEIKIGNLEKRLLGEYIEVNGMLDVPPQSHVSISAPLGGFIKYTEALEGMKINKGQVLATLEHPDYIQLQQDYLESKSHLAFVEEEYNRQAELSKQNINAAKTLQRSESEYLSAKARVEGFRAKLLMANISLENVLHGNIINNVNILSPISGYITKVNINIGKYVGPTDVMMVLVDTRHLHAEAMVYEKDVMKLKIGQTMRFQLADQSEEISSTIYLIGKEIDENRLVRVHCHFDDMDKPILPGMYFNGAIELNAAAVDALPDEAVVQFENDYYIFRVLDEQQMKFEMVKIETGINRDGYTQIKPNKDIEGNIRVVTQGAYDLLSLLMNTEED